MRTVAPGSRLIDRSSVGPLSANADSPAVLQELTGGRYHEPVTVHPYDLAVLRVAILASRCQDARHGAAVSIGRINTLSPQ